MVGGGTPRVDVGEWMRVDPPPKEGALSCPEEETEALEVMLEEESVADDERDGVTEGGRVTMERSGCDARE